MTSACVTAGVPSPVPVNLPGLVQPAHPAWDDSLNTRVGLAQSSFLLLKICVLRSL